MSVAHLPRRSAARFLKDAPADVVAIYDNGGKSRDRFSILTRSWHNAHARLVECLGLSENPSSPLGFSQFCGATRGPHLGRKIAWNDLPENVRKHAHARLTA